MCLLAVYLLLIHICSLIWANSTGLPRMTFTDKETAMKRFPLPYNHVLVRPILGEPDTVTVAGQKQLISFNLENPHETMEGTLMWEECSGGGQQPCNYKITMVHERKQGKPTFVCGTNDRETLCCDMDPSKQPLTCAPSTDISGIKGSIKEFVIHEGEPSALVESAGSADLYIAYSGSQEYVGIHKFGRSRVGPAIQNKEKRYVGLVPSRRKDNHLQDRLYGFFNEKNSATGLYSAMWLPYVTQVCMADAGGPKNILQFSWTSQLNARLFCGDPESRQHFSELVDVATVHGERWEDTRVYALFRNEWNMSAVCAYTIGDIDSVFAKSSFKGNHKDRPRECVADSTSIPLDTLMLIEKTSEMQEWVRPASDFGPLLFKHHSYTHIDVDSFQHKRNNHHPVLFLSLNRGGIHKVISNKRQAFVISEYQAFKHGTHILSVILHHSSGKLYATSENELVQMEVVNCAQYGDSCEQCVLARDPYCGWNGTHCTPETRDIVQDVAQGDHTLCKSKVQPSTTTTELRKSSDAHAHKNVVSIPYGFNYFLPCPVSSHHAQYTWHHAGNSSSCSFREQQCLLLIHRMGPDQVGEYKCVSEEKGYRRVLAQYQLQLTGEAVAHPSSSLLWVCLFALLVSRLSC